MSKPPTPADPPNGITPVEAGIASGHFVDVLGWSRTYFSQHRLDWDDPSAISHAHDALGSFGVFGLEVPQAYGGLGLRATDALKVIEQLGAIDLSLGCRVVAHQNTVQALIRHGSDEQKGALLSALAVGSKRAAFAMTEQQGGANLRGLKTFADTTAGGFFLHGKKAFCGGADEADVLTVFARLGKGGPITAFLVDRDAEGIDVSPALPLLGVHGLRVHDVTLRRVFVPEDRVLGGLGRGINVAEDALRRGRLAVVALALGSLKRSLQWMARFSDRRRIATGRLLDAATVNRRMVALTHATSALTALTHEVTSAYDRGEAPPTSSSSWPK